MSSPSAPPTPSSNSPAPTPSPPKHSGSGETTPASSPNEGGKRPMTKNPPASPSPAPTTTSSMSETSAPDNVPTDLPTASSSAPTATTTKTTTTTTTNMTTGLTKTPYQLRKQHKYEERKRARKSAYQPAADTTDKNNSNDDVANPPSSSSAPPPPPPATPESRKPRKNDNKKKKKVKNVHHVEPVQRPDGVPVPGIADPNRSAAHELGIFFFDPTHAIVPNINKQFGFPYFTPQQRDDMMSRMNARWTGNEALKWLPYKRAHHLLRKAQEADAGRSRPEPSRSVQSIIRRMRDEGTIKEYEELVDDDDAGWKDEKDGDADPDADGGVGGSGAGGGPVAV
ncbi:hypothetical protein HDV00_007288 [Rhizophlyctis rosea]|nr:hypothetical protein HDV00_007288 [Rhizophlyctis rosea]